MGSNLRPLRLSVGAASALGLLSIHLSGELATAWLALSWTAWCSGFLLDHYPGVQARLRRLETPAVAGMIAMVFLDFFVFRYTIFIAVTHFLLLFQIVKLIGEKTRKDCLQIFLFSFFQVLAACTLSVDPWHAAVLLILIPIATAALFWNQMARENEKTPGSADAAVQRNYRRMAVMICAGALPLILTLTAAVFVIFPRLTINAPIAGFRRERMGYIDQVNLSQKGTLQQNASVVLWLSFPNAQARAAWTGYLRGDVLGQFNGRQWSVSRSRASRILTPDSNGAFYVRPPESPHAVIQQTITLADTSAGTLFVIGRPSRILAPLPALQENDGGSLHWISPWRKPLRYEVISEPYSDREMHPVDLETPNVPLARIRLLADQIAGRGSPENQARRLEKFLQKNYRYSNSLGDQVADNPVESFLFERREGPCGYFASALAVMLRLRHIPSRLVAGYLKGEWNEPAQAIVIRERDAHAWVEAYIEGKGWVPFDPSPRQIAAASSGGPLVRRLSQYGDYFGYLWNRFVIQYDLYAQIKAFETLKGGSGRLGADLASWWGKMRGQYRRPHGSAEGAPGPNTAEAGRLPYKRIAGFLFITLLSVAAWKRERRTPYDSALRFYGQFLQRMARAGFPKHSWETGREFARRLARSKPEAAELSGRITEQYYLARFRN